MQQPGKQQGPAKAPACGLHGCRYQAATGRRVSGRGLAPATWNTRSMSAEDMLPPHTMMTTCRPWSCGASFQNAATATPVAPATSRQQAGQHGEPWKAMQCSTGMPAHQEMYKGKRRCSFAGSTACAGLPVELPCPARAPPTPPAFPCRSTHLPPACLCAPPCPSPPLQSPAPPPSPTRPQTAHTAPE